MILMENKLISTIIGKGNTHSIIVIWFTHFVYWRLNYLPLNITLVEMSMRLRSLDICDTIAFWKSTFVWCRNDNYTRTSSLNVLVSKRTCTPGTTSDVDGREWRHVNMTTLCDCCISATDFSSKYYTKPRWHQPNKSNNATSWYMRWNTVHLGSFDGRQRVHRCPGAS